MKILEKIGDDGIAERLKVVVGERLCELKRINGTFAVDPDFLAMLVEEARVTDGMKHPNLIETLDSGAEEGSPWILLEHVEGKTLQETRAAAKLPEPLAAWIVANVLRGLHYAHTRPGLGLVHRDVCPQNVMLGWSGAVKLGGFSIVRTDANARTETAGIIKGRFPYLSPEQTRGQTIDGRTDVFACATMLYELLTERNPYQRESDLQTLEAILFSTPDPIEGELGAIVARGHAELGKRWPSAEAFANAIDGWLEKSEPAPTPRSLTRHLRGLFDPEAID